MTLTACFAFVRMLFFCNVAKPGRCLLEEGKSIFYLDDDHLNTTGARLLSMRIADQIAERGWLK